MQDYLNALRDVVNRIGNERENNGVQDQNNQHLNHLPNPRNISFTIPDQQMDILHATSVIARSRVRQQLYHPEQQFAPCPRPPLWDEEMRAMMILWIARERRLFEWEMREMEHLLGLRRMAYRLADNLYNRPVASMISANIFNLRILANVITTMVSKFELDAEVE